MNDYKNRSRDSMGRVGGEVNSVTIMPPGSLKLDGDTGESLIRWKKLPSGELSIVAIDGVRYGNGKEMVEEETETDVPIEEGMV